MAQPRVSGPGSEACSARHATALGQVACELARGLPVSASPTLVIATAVSGELAPERRADLGRRLAAMIAGELGAHAQAFTSIAALPAAQSQARSARVIAVAVEIDRARLAATADVLAAPRRFWERFQEQATRVVAHAFSTRPLDPELRGYLPKVPLVIGKTHQAVLDEPAVALACGDLDQDGSPELAVVGRQRTRLGRVVKGVFRATQVAAWNELSGLSPSPLREPIAAAIVSSDGRLLLGSTDRANGVELDSELRVLRRYPARIPWGLGGCARRAGLGLSPERVSCSPSANSVDRTSGSASAPDPIDAFAAARAAGDDGTLHEVTAARRQSDARLRLEIGRRHVEIAEPVGAQLALGDLDGDGRLELVTTDAGHDPASDSLLVRTLHEDGRATPVLRIPVGAGLNAVTICPPGANGFSALVAAAGDGLWIFE